MKKNKKTVWLSIFRWFVPADFENWLEKMALEGWNVGHLGQFSSIRMDFKKTEPKKYRYVFDLKAFPKKEYMDIYCQFGWEFVGQMASCFVWRKEYTDVRPESFSDRESVIHRNNRVIHAVTVVFWFFVAGIFALLLALFFTFPAITAEKIIEYLCEALFLAVCAVYFGWVIRQIRKSNDRY